MLKMGCSFSYNKNMFTVLLVLSIFLASIQLGAMRPLGEKWLKQDNRAVFQSLKTDPKHPGTNPCSNIPGGSGSCNRKFAGNVLVHAPAFPNFVMDVAVDSIADKTRPDHSSS